MPSAEVSRQGAFTIPPPAPRQRTYGEVFLNLFTFEIDIWDGSSARLNRPRHNCWLKIESKTVITTLISDVATAYFNLLEFDMEIAIAGNTLGNREQSLRLLRTQLQGGVGTMLDVRQGEQLVYTAAEAIPDAERQIQQTEIRSAFCSEKIPDPWHAPAF